MTENDSPLKRQKDKSKINFYYLLTVCKLQTVNPSQMISENAEDDQTNTIIWYSSEVKQNKSTPDVISTVRGEGLSHTDTEKRKCINLFCNHAHMHQKLNSIVQNLKRIHHEYMKLAYQYSNNCHALYVFKCMELLSIHIKQ